MSGGESLGHEEVVSLLLESGADPNSRNEEQQTPIYWAAASGNEKIVDLLLLWGGETSIRDAHGSTPRQFAIDNGCDDTVINMLT